ncbi:MAG: HTH-type transcriptional repressor FabR [Glaciecola sp.]|jgi:TetR/AcrR family transcriptional regulator, fatty acid biosynthesis regulator|nr:HTH-type transcriptional repressor FabR [Glaciecola sp.]MDG1815620.1 HTH-type transcriptional repressor FabR [Glaciecola sp.]MDG2100578.1 HTH-type transcriptional repressor FabR [Glaciecola sp.]
MTAKKSREQQKQETRQNIINAAFACLDAEKSLSSLSLREIARNAGIAPTSFYRHFKDVNDLGMTLVDEAGLMLRQLMRSARRRITQESNAIDTSVDTLMEFINENKNVFRVLLREHTGTSAEFRSAVQREIQHFIKELSDYIMHRQKISQQLADLQSEAMVMIVFSAGAQALDAQPNQQIVIAEKVKHQLMFVQLGVRQFKPK